MKINILKAFGPIVKGSAMISPKDSFTCVISDGRNLAEIKYKDLESISSIKSPDMLELLNEGIKGQHKTISGSYVDDVMLKDRQGFPTWRATIL